MYEEPNEPPAEDPSDPKLRAKEKAAEFRMHAEFAAVFEACRKFDAQIVPGMNADVARDIQRTMAKLAKSKTPESPVLPDTTAGEGTELLRRLPELGLSSNDYHVYRRPGEVMIVRWIEGEQVDSFYQRLQAHFEVAMTDFREEERQSLAWRKDPKTLKYLEALDGPDVPMAERFLREPIKTFGLAVLSTQTVDEMDILHLCDYVMGVPAAEVVGEKSAPPEEPTHADRAWFFKLFSLRGVVAGAGENGGEMERMCFFTFMQKSDDLLGDDE